MSKSKLNTAKFKFWKSILIFAGIFSLLISVLLIVNYFQINRVDPVNSKVINSLVEKLNQNPGDIQLRNEVREFDLLARKAYFINQWQIRFGGYLLLASLLLTVISILMMDSYNKLIEPVITSPGNDNAYIQKKTRKWISFGGIAISVTALFLAFLTHKNIGNRFNSFSVKFDTTSNIGKENSPDKSSESGLVNDSALKNNIDSAKNKTTDVLMFPTDEVKNNFPSFRGVGGNGIVYQKNIPENWDGATGKNIKWKSSIPLPGYNSPVIWGNKVFLSGSNGSRQEVYCFDLNSGKLLWTTGVKNTESSNAKTPKVTEDTGFSASTVTCDGQNVYAIFANGVIISLDMNGNKVWERDLGLPDNHYGYASSLITIDNKVIVQYDQNKSANILALSTKTGKTVWTCSRNVKISWSSPVIATIGSKNEILLLADPYLASYDPSTGKELWKIDCTSGEVGPSVAYANGIAFTVNDYAKLAAVQITGNPKIIWEHNDYLSDVPSPVANDKYLILATSTGEVACYNPKTGELYWNHDFGTGSYSSPIMVGEKVYLLDKNGTMHIFKSDKTFNLISEPKIAEKNVYATPAFANNKLLIRGGTNLYCIGK